MSFPAEWTLADASAALAKGAVTSRVLTESCIARIAAWQPVTNAFIDLRADAALEAAAKADAEIAADGMRSPLHGIPLAHKDMYYRTGQISTCGSTLRRDWRATETATVLARLDAAGAIDLGTLNMAEWAAGATGHNLWFGDACNPWNPAYATGGSSAGSGAAVAARMVLGALGSDTGGSIRLPASMCGVTGLKPTWGAVSRHGVMPRAWTLDTVGPLAQTAEDCALLFEVIAGPDAADPTSAQAPGLVCPPISHRLAGITIGVERAMLDAADPSLRPALDAALAQLRDLGATLIDVAIPDLPAIFDLAGIVSNTEAASIHLEQLRAHPEGYAPDLFMRSQTGMVIPAVLYLQALRMRGEMLRRAREAVFASCTAMFAPSIALPVPTRAASWVETAADAARIHGPLVRMTRPFNYLGLPVLSMPCGFDPSGLPIGFQLAGAPFDESGLLTIGMAYERATPWHHHLPELPA